MSNIYIQEPPTSGKVLLKTTLGDIDIELWSKEAPKACRNFIQLALEGYYDNCIFHRVVKGFIAQGGDPTGTGFGGESIYGEPFKDEFHSRIKFNRRGLLAMANAGKDDNASQFFFTLAATPELQGKHTIFGKVTGKTVYNMIKFDELQVDRNDRPRNPPKIIRTEILSNPFDDILPRDLGKSKSNKDEDNKREKQSTAVAKKDFKLLSFGEEAEEEEELVSQVSFKGGIKSSHDLTDDPTLSSQPAVDVKEISSHDKSKKKKKKHRRHEDEDVDHNKKSKNDQGDSKKEEFKNPEPSSSSSSKTPKATEATSVPPQVDALEAARNEYKKLKMEMIADRKRDLDKKLGVEEKPKDLKNKALNEFLSEIGKYSNGKKKIAKKGSSDREEQTLAALSKFKKSLKGDESESKSNSLWAHKLCSNPEDEGPVLAKDANKRGEDGWYDLYDPRNKIAQRRAGKDSAK